MTHSVLFRRPRRPCCPDPRGAAGSCYRGTVDDQACRWQRPCDRMVAPPGSGRGDRLRGRPHRVRAGRAARDAGIDLRVMTPGLIPKRPTDRVKADRRDAVRQARLLVAGELSFARVPTLAEVAFREFGPRPRGRPPGSARPQLSRAGRGHALWRTRRAATPGPGTWCAVRAPAQGSDRQTPRSDRQCGPVGLEPTTNRL